MDPPPPPSSDTGFPILAVAILGILTTAFLLISYYMFAMKCGINWRRSDLLLRRLSSTWSRRHRPPVIYAAAAAGEGRGLDLSAIRSIPIIRFTSAGATEAHRRQQSFHECAVCLNEFQEEEKLRLLPNCFHVFHIDCIDTWLQTNTNCPLCRSDVTSPLPIPLTEPCMVQGPLQEQSGSIVIEVRGGGGGELNPRGEAPINPSPRKWEQRKKGRRFYSSAAASMGDECIDVREKDEQFCVQPIRRSLSMDSSNDRQLYLSVQEILKRNQNCVPEVRNEVGNGEGTSSCGGVGSASGRIRRSLFSFGLGRSSRSAVLPVEIDL